MKEYLENSEYIDWQDTELQSEAKFLSKGLETDTDIAKSCFEYMRDNIKHSFDYELNPVTVKASDVLRHGTGYCYAKSHLLAALLRANDIPAALCYQRLTIDNDQPPFCLHGLNAVYLKNYGWYRVDARGNKPGVEAEFCPPREQLAFPLLSEGEADVPGLHAKPLAAVTEVLEKYDTYLDVVENLPDDASFESI